MTRQPKRKGSLANAPTEPSHRASDIVGIVLVTLGVLLGATLAVGNGGLIGDALATALTAAFGRGAWVLVIVLLFGGGSLLAGRTDVALGRVSGGIATMFLAGIGFLGQPRNGDYFDQEAMDLGGGSVGAVVSWGFSQLFGVARPLALTALLLIGVALAIDQPIRSLLNRLKRSDTKKTLEDRLARARSIEEAPKRAVVAVSATEVENKPELNERAKKALAILSKQEPKTPQKVVIPRLDTHSAEGYELPSLSLLQEPSSKARRSAHETQQNIETLETTLEQFGIDANVVEVAHGPAITRYELQLGPGIRVNRITALGDNIAMNLSASHVRVEAPIPGKNAIGVEVPNAARSMVTLREMIENLEFHSDELKLGVALGQDVSGTPKYLDMTKMPHILVAGATNSGKSICLATMIMSLIMRHTPKEVRLVMVDPKRVELALFDGLPHLMCPVVKDVKEAAGVLRAVVREMERRIDRFSDEGVRNIDGWNAKAESSDKLPYIVVVIDEMADLMVQVGPEVETCIFRLAQLARATGIHLVLATQRPSVDVITGTIKNNIPSRIAFAVSSHIDSRTILDQAGADKLIGKGDMLYLPIDQTKPTRIQGCYVTEKEIEKVCTFWRNQERPQYTLNPVQVAIEEREAEMREEQEADPLWEDAVRFVVSRGEASTSMLQRKFAIGFQRASRLLDLMEERAIVGPREGPKPRTILVDPVQMEAALGNDRYMTPMPDDAMTEDWDQP